MKIEKAIELLNSHKFQKLFDFVIINSDEDYEDALYTVLDLVENLLKETTEITVYRVKK